MNVGLEQGAEYVWESVERVCILFFSLFFIIELSETLIKNFSVAKSFKYLLIV